MRRKIDIIIILAAILLLFTGCTSQQDNGKTPPANDGNSGEIIGERSFERIPKVEDRVFGWR